MAVMNRSNLAHGSMLMHLSATFPSWNGRPARAPISEVPMLMDLRVTWSRFSNESSEIMHKSEEFLFCSTHGTILLPQLDVGQSPTCTLTSSIQILETTISRSTRFALLLLKQPHKRCKAMVSCSLRILLSTILILMHFSKESRRLASCLL